MSKYDIKDLFGAVAAVAAVVVMLWAFCAATPSQLSGEGDWSRGVAAGEVAE